MHKDVCEREAALATAGASQRMEFRGRRVHMIGIGGCGMIGIAHLLLDLGAEVSGSDMQMFDGFGELVAAGARVHLQHDQAQVDPDCDLIVHSAAVPGQNAELVAASRLGIPTMTYAKTLGAVMAHRTGIALAGTHGKTTTTAMCAHLMRESGLDPSFVVGGQCPQLGGSSGSGRGRHFVVESCEFGRSFLHLNPEMAAVLNVESDHLDYYQSLDEIVEAFGCFASRVKPGGLLAVNAEDTRAMAAVALAGSQARVETFATGCDADWRAVNLACTHGCYGFDVLYRGEHLLSTRLALPGLYSVLNALAAIAMGYHAGADAGTMASALPKFEGVFRRMTVRGCVQGVTIVDDYAHHPTEIRVTLEAARGLYGPKRTWVIFQPHQYSRTRALLDEFAGAFALADEVIVPEQYAAREAKDAYGVTGSQELASRIGSRGVSACFLPSFASVAAHVAERVSPGDLVMTMGAGDVWKVADALVDRIRVSG